MNSGVLPKWLIWTTGILSLVGALLLLVVRFYQIQGARAEVAHVQDGSRNERGPRRGRTTQAGMHEWPSRRDREGNRPRRDREEFDAISLFDGKTLSGWTTRSGSPGSSWAVRDGVLTNIRPGEDLFSIREFEDCKLELEFAMPPECNSGVYLRGRYEIQLLDTAAEAKLRKKPWPRFLPTMGNGALFEQIAPSSNHYLGANIWNEVSVSLLRDDLTVEMNSQKILEGKVSQPTQGSLFPIKGALGPIVLQAANTPGMRFRNIRVTPLD